MGTHKFRPEIPPCGVDAGLRMLPPDGTYLRMREEPLSDDLPRRPKDFRLTQVSLDRYDGIPCRRVYLVMFEDSGRFFVLHLGFGANASKSLRLKTLEVLDTLRVGGSSHAPLGANRRNKLIPSSGSGSLRSWKPWELLRGGRLQGTKLLSRRTLLDLAFLLQLPQYRGRFDVALFAEPPDITNVKINNIPVKARSGEWTLHAGWVRKVPLQQFIAASPDLCITVHVIPREDRTSRGAMKKWFHRLADAVADHPAPSECV